MKSSEKVDLIAQARVKAQKAFTPVPKNKTATVKTKSGGEYKYKYADLADCLAMALPHLSANDIVLTQPHALVDGKLRVTTHLLHVSGQWMESDGIEILENGDPQHLGQQSTYYRRYDGCSFLGIAPDEDTDAQGVKAAPKEIIRKSEKNGGSNLGVKKWDATEPGFADGEPRRFDDDRTEKSAYDTARLQVGVEEDGETPIFDMDGEPVVTRETPLTTQLKASIQQATGNKPYSMPGGQKQVGIPRGKRWFAIGMNAGRTKEELNNYLGQLGVERSEEIPVSKYEEACTWAAGQ
jgi:hypothetical protein